MEQLIRLSQLANVIEFMIGKSKEQDVFALNDGVLTRDAHEFINNLHSLAFLLRRVDEINEIY